MAKGGEHVAMDVFEVFDRRSGAEHTPPPPPRFQGAKTFFAVSLAVAVLVGMALGAYSLVRGIAAHKNEASLCTPAQTDAQQTVVSWLGDRVSQATGANDVSVKPTGCAEQTDGQPIGGKVYLRDRGDLSGAMATLQDHGCEMAISAAGTGTCTVDVDGITSVVRIAKTPDTDTTADGDYTMAIEVKKLPAAPQPEDTSS